jgi:uncharacterized protein YcsI (UPF0317 family)
VHALAYLAASYSPVLCSAIYAGDPAALGIADINKPDYGDAVTIFPGNRLPTLLVVPQIRFAVGEVPVFWACGVTPQVALLAAKLPIAITHAPGHMFVTDRLNSELAGPAELKVAPSDNLLLA